MDNFKLHYKFLLQKSENYFNYSIFIEVVLLTILIIALIVQLLYYILFVLKFNKPIIKTDQHQSISIVVCCQNEAANLNRLIPILMQQNYSDFELVIVDDGSIDNTAELVAGFQKKYQQLNYIFVDPKQKVGVGKKYALQQGVLAAKHNIIVVTDADCFPASKNWLQLMINAKAEKSIVLGISMPFNEINNNVVRLQDYETSVTALQYISLANVGIPYMAVGRNMLFEKQVFLEKKWSKQEMEMLSGDDDLFIQTQATASNNTACTHQDAYTCFYPKTTWKEWFKQKQRHLSTGFVYQIQHQVILSVFLISKLFIYLCSFVLMFYDIRISIFLILYWLVLSIINYSFHKKNNLFHFPITTFIDDVIYSFSIIFIGLISFLKPTTTWK